MGVARLESRRHERPCAPDAAEIVDLRDAFDPLGLDVEEARAGMPALLTRRCDPRVALEDARGDRVDLGAIGDVAALPLAAELVRERAQPFLAAGDEHAAPAALR